MALTITHQDTDEALHPDALSWLNDASPFAMKRVVGRAILMCEDAPFFTLLQSIAEKKSFAYVPSREEIDLLFAEADKLDSNEFKSKVMPSSIKFNETTTITVSSPRDLLDAWRNEATSKAKFGNADPILFFTFGLLFDILFTMTFSYKFILPNAQQTQTHTSHAIPLKKPPRWFHQLLQNVAEILDDLLDEYSFTIHANGGGGEATLLPVSPGYWKLFGKTPPAIQRILPSDFDKQSMAVRDEYRPELTADIRELNGQGLMEVRGSRGAPEPCASAIRFRNEIPLFLYIASRTDAAQFAVVNNNNHHLELFPDRRLAQACCFHCQSNALNFFQLSGPYRIKKSYLFPPGTGAYSLIGRAEDVQDEDYFWGGSLPMGLTVGLKLSRRIPSNIDPMWLPAYQHKDTIYYRMPLPLSQREGVPEIAYFRRIDVSKRRRHPPSTGFARLFLPDTSPRAIKAEFRNRLNRPFPQLRKKNKGDFKPDNESVWKSNPLNETGRPVGKRKPPLQTFRKLLRLLTTTGDAPKTATETTRKLLNGQPAIWSDYFVKMAVNDIEATSILSKPEALYGKRTDQEWCHLVGHGDGGTETLGNLVAGSNHCNTEQLALEVGIRFFQDIHDRHIRLRVTSYALTDEPVIVDNDKIRDDYLDVIQNTDYLPGGAAGIQKWMTIANIFVAENIIIDNENDIFSLIVLGQYKKRVGDSISYIDIEMPLAVRMLTILDGVFFGKQQTYNIKITVLFWEFIREIFREHQERRALNSKEIDECCQRAGKDAGIAARMKLIKNYLVAAAGAVSNAAFIYWPVGLYVRYHVTNYKGQTIFDHMIDAQRESFDRNEFSILSELTKWNIIYAFHDDPMMDQKEYISQAINLLGEASARASSNFRNEINRHNITGEQLQFIISLSEIEGWLYRAHEGRPVLVPPLLTDMISIAKNNHFLDAALRTHLSPDLLAILPSGLDIAPRRGDGGDVEENLIKRSETEENEIVEEKRDSKISDMEIEQPGENG